MEKELDRREKELASERRKAAEAATENALLREHLRAMEAGGSGGSNLTPLPIPTPPLPIPTPPIAPLTQLPFDPQFLAAWQQR